MFDSCVSCLIPVPIERRQERRIIYGVSRTAMPGKQSFALGTLRCFLANQKRIGDDLPRPLTIYAGREMVPHSPPSF